MKNLIKYTPMYALIRKSQLAPYSPVHLQNAVLEAIKNVPFYNGYDKYIKSPFSIKDFPILCKKDILGNETLLISKRAFKAFLSRKETGGSTGYSLKLFYSPSVIIEKEVIPNYAFSLIGWNLRIATLRGQRPANGKLWQATGNGNIILSSYQLSEDNLDEYLKILRERHISCLHVYPSSLFILARLIKCKYGKVCLPDLKGILASSEIFSVENKKLVKEVFPGVKIIDFYGHNELACCAIAENDGFYHFFKNYGYVEFIETGETVNGNRIAEIVATSIMNTAMPFIRYATEDYVELDKDGNVVSIIGRTSDFVVNADGALTPCIVVTRDRSMMNISNFQYYQSIEGELTFRIVVNQEFNQIDQQYLLEDMNESFNGRMVCKVEIVNSIERTKAGKQKRLVQELNLNKYK